MKSSTPSMPLFSTQRVSGFGFIAFVLGMILSIHCVYIFLVFLPKLWRLDILLWLLVYHCFFGNLLFSFYQCIVTDPGKVPANWGFYMGDETKRRRYCKMCNVWKPDRVHHCSICNRCILNMDHHCPWIDNCVGFYNRKFFIQLLLYVFATLSIFVVTALPEAIVDTWSMFTYSESRGLWHCCKKILIDMSLLMALLLLGTLFNFIKFHVKLVLENYTTIENLEREEGAKSKFDIGRRRNWEQVFGANAWLWWLPVHTQASRPVGDGVRWRVHYTRVIDEDEELPADSG